MHYLFTAVTAALVASVSAHGVLTEIQGANGVKMPGLSVIDGTPRDCASPLCGSEDDTSLIRNRELAGARASALGRTPKGGAVDARKRIAIFMGQQPMSKREVASSNKKLTKRQLLDLLGGIGGNGNGSSRTQLGSAETGWSRMAGQGAYAGLPTASDDGIISVTYHQVNQDGAGPLTAFIDPSSVGSDPKAFQQAEIMQNVPGVIGGLSTFAVRDWPVKIKMPQGMQCSGTAGNVQNVCVVRIANSALAGPFGGSAAFTQSPRFRRRSIKNQHYARGLIAKLD